MSIYVCGNFSLLEDNDVDISKLRKMSFEIQQKANDLRIGFVVGGAAKNAQNLIGNLVNDVLFEITDSPFETTAEGLFSSDAYNTDADFANFILKERMSLVQQLFSYMFSYKEILQISLYVNYIFGDIDIMRCMSIDDFTSYILNDYEKSTYFCPALKYEIHR